MAATILSIVTLLGWCLVHFVWQAAVVGMLYAAARMLLPRGNARYIAAMAALLLLALAPLATVWHEWPVASSMVDFGDATVVAADAGGGITETAPVLNWQALLQAALPWLVLAWSIGVGVLGLRVLRQWRSLRAMLRAAEALPGWQARAQAFASKLGLRRVVPVLASVRVATPTLVGWLRPAVVLPLAVLARMPPAQIDMVLAHELAHLRRYDHIANLCQVVLETLFYFHPVVHWISRDARNERELCCDAMALRLTGGTRRDFVAALAELEDLRGLHPDLALAASGGVLVERALFIAGAMPAQHHPRARGVALATFCVTSIVAIMAWNGIREASWQRWVARVVAANQAAISLHIETSPLVLVVPAVRVAGRSLLVAPVVARAPSAADVVDPALPIELPAPVAPVLNVRDVAPRLAPILATETIAAPVALASPLDAAAPKPLHSVQPVYPVSALESGQEAKVVLAFRVNALGRPQDIETVGAADSQFAVAAKQALAAWRFPPSSSANQRYRQTFTFVIGDAGRKGGATARACVVRTGSHLCLPVADAQPLRQ